MPATAIVRQDLSKGTNVATNPYDLGRQQSVLLTNLILDEHGSLHTRDGTKIQTTAPDTRPIVKLFDFVRGDGVIFKLAIKYDAPNQLYNRETNPWTLIGSFDGAETLPDILAFTNLALIINGYERPWSYDGVTFQHVVAVDNPAGAKHHALHQGFWWLWNTAPATGTATFASYQTTTGIANADILYTAVLVGAAGNAITIAYVNAGANMPLVVSVVGTAVSVQMRTDGAGNVINPAADIVAAVNAFPAAAALLVASAIGDGTGVPNVAVGVTNLAGGAGAGASTSDGPSSLRSSDLNKPQVFPPAFQIFIDKDDGDQGMGIGQFTIAETGISPTTSLILFKRSAAYQMTGVFGSTNPAFSIQKIKSDVGCVAPRTIRFAPGFGLLRLTDRGVALFNGVDDTLVSEEIRPLLFGSDTFPGIDWSNVSRCQAAVIANPPLYVLWAPSNGPALDRAFCYDLVRKAWSVLYYPTTISTADTIRDPGQIPVTLIGDYDQGSVRSIFNPAASASKDDDGTPIAWSWNPAPAFAPSPQQNGYFHIAVIKVFDTADQYQIFWSALFGPVVNANPPTKSGVITLPAPVPPVIGAGGGWGVDPYGLLPYGSVGVPSSEVDATIGLGIIATNCRLAFSGLGQATIRGLEFHVKPLPLRRPSVYV